MIPEEIVDRYYWMNPETDILLKDSTRLREGMVILIEAAVARRDANHTDPSYRYEALERNRWSQISDIEWDDSDEMFDFTSTYADGSQKRRTGCKSTSWLVRIDTGETWEQDLHDFIETDPKVNS